MIPFPRSAERSYGKDLVEDKAGDFHSLVSQAEQPELSKCYGGVMSKEAIIIILGEDTPKEVKAELDKFKSGAVLTFSWDNEDNECMPKTAEYLLSKYNVYECGLI